MKIAYINGYNPNKIYKGTKHIELSNYLNNKVDLIEYKYYDNNLEEIEEKAKDYDLIIASSTGAYLARNICYKHNILLVSLNPVIDLEHTFKKLNVPKPNIPNGIDKSLKELILVNKDDELIHYKNTLDLFGTRVKVLDKGTHRFYNLEEGSKYIKEFIDTLLI